MTAEPDPRLEQSEALDPGAWVDRHADVLYRYARSRLRDREAAEDVVQETLLAALKTRDGFAGRSTERTWLIGILRHKIVDHLRQRSREQSVTEQVAPEDFFDERGKWKIDPGPWPTKALSPQELDEFRAALATCAELLPPGLAEVFILRELEALDSKSVCDLLGISPTNLWTRLHRLRMMLRRCLERRWLGQGTDDDEKDAP